MSMTPNEYQQDALRTECNQEASRMRMSGYTPERNAARRSPETGMGSVESQLAPVRLTHGSFGVAKEAGELLGVVEKWIYYGQTIDVKNMVKDEAGDVLWYLSIALAAVGLTLEEVMAANIRKLKVRYPECYSDDLAADEARKREAEKAAILGLPRDEVLQDGHGFGYHPDDPT
jgi:NTP pyrophosphatase (non-canonical NTP hydrolase)